MNVKDSIISCLQEGKKSIPQSVYAMLMCIAGKIDDGCENKPECGGAFDDLFTFTQDDSQIEIKSKSNLVIIDSAWTALRLEGEPVAPFTSMGILNDIAPRKYAWTNYSYITQANVEYGVDLVIYWGNGDGTGLCRTTHSAYFTPAGGS